MTLFELFGKIIVENKEANDNIDKTKEKAKELGDSFEEAGNSADNTSGKLGEGGKIGAASVWLGLQFEKLGSAAYNFAKKGVVAGYEYNKMMESYTASFKVLTGSEETAVKLLDDLWGLAAETPLEMAGLADASTLLLNYGVSIEKLIPTLRMLGDASMGDQNKLIGIARAYGQVLSYGELRGQETNQLVENGFPILKILSQMTGKTSEELLQLREKGGLTADMLTDAFILATSEGGQYFQSMMEFAQTLEGQEAKLHDNLSQMLGNLMKPFTDEYKDSFLPGLSESIEKLNEFITENEDSIASFAESLGNIASDAFDGLINAFQWLIENQKKIEDTFFVIGESIRIAFSPITKSIDFLNGLVDKLQPKSGSTVSEIYMERNFPIQEYDPNTTLIPITKEQGNAATGAAEGTAEAYAKANAEIQAMYDKLLNLPQEHQFKILFEIYTKYGLNPDGTVIEGSHKTGLGFVPRDNYIAKLHQGEAVLTADEAREWRSGKSGRQEVYQEETVISGNTFIIQKEQDIYALAVELNSLKRESRRGRGKRN